MKYSILLVFIMAIGLLRCGSISKENELKEWEGWYGEVAGGEPWLNLYLENDSLYCQLIKSTETKKFKTEAFESTKNLDLRSLTENLIAGIPHIKSAIKTENFLLFRVETGGIPEFISDYYFFVPKASVGGPMKKMDPPSHMTNSDD